VTLVIPAKVTTRGEGESGHDRTASNRGRSEKDTSDAVKDRQMVLVASGNCDGMCIA